MLFAPSFKNLNLSARNQQTSNTEEKSCTKFEKCG